MANMIARLGVVLGLDSAEFSRGLDSAGKKLEQFSQSAEKFGRIGATALLAASVAAAVCTKFVAIQTVEKKDNNVLW